MEIGVHTQHCYQGEYPGSCKYGDPQCPAIPRVADEIIHHSQISTNDSLTIKDVFISYPDDETITVNLTIGPKPEKVIQLLNNDPEVREEYSKALSTAAKLFCYKYMKTDR